MIGSAVTLTAAEASRGSDVSSVGMCDHSKSAITQQRSGSDSISFNPDVQEIMSSYI